MKDISYSVPKVSDINLDSVMDEISSKIQEESSGWGGVIAAGAIGAVIGLLLSGPLGWIIGGGALLGKLFFGDSEEEKQAKAMAKDLNKEERGKIIERKLGRYVK